MAATPIFSPGPAADSLRERRAALEGAVAALVEMAERGATALAQVELDQRAGDDGGAAVRSDEPAGVPRQDVGPARKVTRCHPRTWVSERPPSPIVTVRLG